MENKKEIPAISECDTGILSLDSQAGMLRCGSKGILPFALETMMSSHIRGTGKSRVIEAASAE